MSKLMILYPHGLGDCILLTPALKKRKQQTGDHIAVVMLKRFETAELFKHNPYIDKLYFCKDAWHDFPGGFHKGIESLKQEFSTIAKEEGYDEFLYIDHSSHRNKIALNAEKLGVNPLNKDDCHTEIYISDEDKKVADNFVKSRNLTNFGFIQTKTGVPNKDLPDGYGQNWLRQNKGLNQFIEIGKDFKYTDFNINVQFEIMNKANAMCVPDSVFYHASGALDKVCDFAFFGRGRPVYERVKPLHDVKQFVFLRKQPGEQAKLQLPNNYHQPNTYWAQMVTFKCNAACEFCILDRRGRRQDTTELTGKQIVDFWNSIEHRPGQKLSLIGGEPTLHKDIVDIVNGLEGYSITLTTNCKGPFYKDPEFYKKFQPHSSSTLRINTTFHPHFITADEYIDVIQKYRKTGYFVDQTSFVNRPDLEKYEGEVDKVRKEIDITKVPYLGFWSDDEGYAAAFDEENNEPNESYPDDSPARLCGITSFDAYRDMCGQGEKREVTCIHPMRSLIVGPDGKHYHCHYKLYYGIDPVCSIDSFTPVTESDKSCKHYGFCNWCDIPRTGCVKNPTAKKLVLNKLYDRSERGRKEIDTLDKDVGAFATEHNLEYNNLKWFEYSYALLYSGHKHRGKVLDVGSAKSVLPYYLSSKGYKVTTMDVADEEYRKEIGKKYGVDTLTWDLRELNEDLIGTFDTVFNLSVVEHIDEDTKALINLSKYLKNGGIMVVSTDFYDKYIEYPDANRKIVLDRPAGSHTDSRVYTGDTFMERVIKPLEDNGMEVVGDINFENVDISDTTQRSVRGLYTFGVSCFRRK